MTLRELARLILLLHRAPMSRVRFARVIYFSHKELIRKKLMKPEDIAYVRSPLGPIPEGFFSLSEAPGIIARRRSGDHLSYATEEFVIDNDPEHAAETDFLEQYREVLATIEKVLKALKGYTTPHLVENSHREPSWLAHQNGEVYHISPADLKIAFPFTTLPVIRIKIFAKPINKAGELQANLLRGMISDIVKESTDLEYPDTTKRTSRKS